MLLLAFLLPFAGRYTSIKYQAHQVKKKVKWNMIAGLDCAELVQFTFSKKDAKNLNWKHSREFEHEGEWYDIVYTDTIGTDSLQYWLFWDHEETKLNRQLADLIANALGDDPATKDKNNRFNHFTKDLLCIQLTTLNKPAAAINELIFSSLGAIIHRPSVPSNPPPQFVG